MTSYDGIERRVREHRRESAPGINLRADASTGSIVCQQGCHLPPASGSWLHDCHVAMNHARDSGHNVAVEGWQGAMYGPEAGK